jgi:hypothetical protein
LPAGHADRGQRDARNGPDVRPHPLDETYAAPAYHPCLLRTQPPLFNGQPGRRPHIIRLGNPVKPCCAGELQNSGSWHISATGGAEHGLVVGIEKGAEADPAWAKAWRRRAA